MQLHSNNMDNDRIILLHQLSASLSNKEHIIHSTWLSGAQKKKAQCLTLLKDYHVMEIKVGLKTYLCHGVSCMDDRIYRKHCRNTRLIANIIPDSESVHNK